MALTIEDICNSALSKLGAEVISSISDSNRRARLCNNIYNIKRKELLRSHLWNFAVRTTLLDVHTTAVTNANINITTDTLTISRANFFSIGDKVEILSTGTAGTEPSFDGLTLADGSFGEVYVRPTSTTAFTLHLTQEDAIAGDDAIDITAAGTLGVTLQFLEKNNSENKQVFALPSNYLRAIREESKDIDFKIENGILLTDRSTFSLKYIMDVTDPTLFDSNFDEVLALAIAKDLAYPLVQSLTLKESITSDYNVALRDARSFDAQEGTPEKYEANDWTNSRL